MLIPKGKQLETGFKIKTVLFFLQNNFSSYLLRVFLTFNVVLYMQDIIWKRIVY